MHALKFLVLLVVASCATGPYSGQEFDTNIIPVEGLVDEPNTQARFEVFDYGLDRFVHKATFRSESTPTFRAGAICPNSPPLYRYRGTLALNWPVYWDFISTGVYETKLRATHINSVGQRGIVFTDNPNAGSCMADKGFNNTCDFYNIAAQCGYKLGEATIQSCGYWCN